MSYLIPLEILASALAGSSVAYSFYGLLKRVIAEKKLRSKLNKIAKLDGDVNKLLKNIRNEITHNSKPDHAEITKYIKIIENLSLDFDKDERRRILTPLTNNSEKARLSLINEQVTEATRTIEMDTNTGKDRRL